MGPSYAIMVSACPDAGLPSPKTRGKRPERKEDFHFEKEPTRNDGLCGVDRRIYPDRRGPQRRAGAVSYTHLIVTMHIQSVDQTAAIKTIKRIITELDRSKIEEQKKAVRSGYDMDIIPSDLATYGKDAKSLLKELQSQNERMFMVTFLVQMCIRDSHHIITQMQFRQLCV